MRNRKLYLTTSFGAVSELVLTAAGVGKRGQGLKFTRPVPRTDRWLLGSEPVSCRQQAGVWVCGCVMPAERNFCELTCGAVPSRATRPGFWDAVGLTGPPTGPAAQGWAARRGRRDTLLSLPPLAPHAWRSVPAGALEDGECCPRAVNREGQGAAGARRPLASGLG